MVFIVHSILGILAIVNIIGNEGWSKQLCQTEFW